MQNTGDNLHAHSGVKTRDISEIEWAANWFGECGRGEIHEGSEVPLWIFKVSWCHCRYKSHWFYGRGTGFDMAGRLEAHTWPEILLWTGERVRDGAMDSESNQGKAYGKEWDRSTLWNISSSEVVGKRKYANEGGGGRRCCQRIRSVNVREGARIPESTRGCVQQPRERMERELPSLKCRWICLASLAQWIEH